MAIRSYPRFKAFNPTTGALGAGYKLQSYLAGTSTPSVSYSDQALLVANANPVIMDGSGEATVFLDPAISYKLVLKDDADVVIWTVDNINVAEAGNFTTVAASGQITSTAGSGVAPFVLSAGAANVPDLDASKLNGKTFAAPAALGSGTPAAVSCTTLHATGAATLDSTLAVTGAITGTTSVTGATGVFSTADGLSSNGKIVPVIWSEAFYLFGTMVDAHMWIATRACKVRSVKEIHSVVGGAAATVRPRKITDTSAPGAVASATVKEITTAAFDLTAIVNTTVTGTLSATPSDYTFATGDKLSLDMSGTVAGTVGIIVVEFEAV